MKSRLITLLLFTTGFAMTQDYPPIPVPDHQVASYHQFTLCYNEAHEQPDWVYYKLHKGELETNISRSDYFKSDRNITSNSASPDDYRNTGFTRGHLCPAANCEYDSAAYKESFLLSNMSPQLPGFNSGIWKTLEEWERKQVNKYDTIYVVTGPVFINDLGMIGDNQVTVPGYFYKCLLRFEEGSPKTLGFLIPHAGTCCGLDAYIVPVNALETITGLDFFPGLDDADENKAESSVGKSSWKF